MTDLEIDAAIEVHRAAIDALEAMRQTRASSTPPAPATARRPIAKRRWELAARAFRRFPFEAHTVSQRLKGVGSEGRCSYGGHPLFQPDGAGRFPRAPAASFRTGVLKLPVLATITARAAILGGRAGAPVFPALRNYVAEGDSITDSQQGNTAVGKGYANAAAVLANPALARPFTNMAVSGGAMGELNGRAAAVDALLQSGEANILSIFIGANTDAGATFLTQLAAYCDARRSAGWHVLLGTLLPRINSTFNTNRAVANPEIRSWITNGSIVAGKHAGGIFDFAADPVIGPDAAASNTTYFSDGLHPTLTAQVRMRNVFWPVLDATMSNVSTNPIITSISSYSTEAGSPDNLIELFADRGVTWSISGDAAITLQDGCRIKLNTSTPGSYATTITATDGKGRTGTQTFTWTVVNPPAGYGPNLVVNGKGLIGRSAKGLFGFMSNEALWFENFTTIDWLTREPKAGGGSEYKVQGTGGGFPQGPTVTIPTEAGATYKIDAIRKGTASGGPIFRVDGSSSAFLTTNNVTDTACTGTATAGGATMSHILYINNGGAENGAAYFSDLAIRKVLP
ncbi:SGNH/GDSL hydrolase family protein [Bradyrhizobium sp. 157]|uniref:hypothetical protein n=1 Tax=Bradyrhizobium sp. 157 TaxID=2782631 RepID=UPI001FF9B05E|nr:hypothetical protein [Bradyrhizobium sp. 157]MCK1641922.1 SGNH/GDSL hydrolase family protein [Bradyrhizobium sp. 157]